MKKNLLLAALIAAILINTGCTGPQGGTATTTTQSGNNPQTTQPGNGGETATTQGGGAVVTAGGGSTTTPVGGTTGTTAGGGTILGDAKAELKGLFANKVQKYMATYGITSSMGGQQGIKSLMTYYFEGKNKIRVDMPDSGMGEMRTYLDSGSYVVCTKAAQEWSCMKVPQQQTSQDVNQQTTDIQNSIDSSPVERLSDRVIAGTTAQCYHITFTVKDQTTGTASTWDDIYCVSADGVPLYMDGKSGDTEYVMEATKYSTSVSDSDFVPPATPQDMSGALNGIGGTAPAGG